MFRAPSTAWHGACSEDAAGDRRRNDSGSRVALPDTGRGHKHDKREEGLRVMCRGKTLDPGASPIVSRLREAFSRKAVRKPPCRGLTLVQPHKQKGSHGCFVSQSDSGCSNSSGRAGAGLLLLSGFPTTVGPSSFCRKSIIVGVQKEKSTHTPLARCGKLEVTVCFPEHSFCHLYSGNCHIQPAYPIRFYR